MTKLESGDLDLSEAERKKLDAVQAALDNDDFAAVAKAIKEFKSEKNPILRRQAVQALSWFGKQSVPELAKFLSDADEDVSSMANSAMVQAMGEFEESENALKAEYIRTILSGGELLDDDAIVMIAGELRCILDDPLVAQTAAEIISSTSDTRVIDEMKETYEFATGEEYAGSAKAKEWVAQKSAEIAAEMQAEMQDANADAAEAEADTY